MKINSGFYFKGVVLTSLMIMCLSSNTGKFLETEGFASNMEARKVDATNYALAKNTNQDIFGSNFKPPTLVERLPPKKGIETGGPEIIEEIPSLDNYYDGSVGLKTSVTRCNAYETKPQACVNNGGCGWCLETNRCVEGSAKGPASGACLLGRYVFESPDANWNPLNKDAGNVRLDRVNILNAQLSTFTQQGK